MSDILQMKIGSPRKTAIIKEIWTERLPSNERAEKVHMKCESSDGAPYDISEMWFKNHKQEVTVKGIYINRDHTNVAIHPTSLMARLMQYFNVTSVAELIDKEIFVEPKPNGFMAIVAYDDTTS